ncbi:MAG TPA: glycerophosphodiester phosphodiesterase family protein [Tepidiformaceae bacterium]
MELSTGLPGSGGDLSPVIAGARRVFCCHRAQLTGNHPPNSLAAIQESVAAGAPRLEIDIRFLADDSLMVVHDRSLPGVSGALERIDVLDRAAAQALHLRATGTQPCFLEEVVEVMAPFETLLQVDLKLMRPLTTSRLERLANALAPLGDRVLIGSQGYWNLQMLAAKGLPVAFDPTLQWHYFPGRKGEGLSPARLGLHGLWDDATIAHTPAVAFDHYIQSRVTDLLSLVEGVREWMVDSRTLLHIASLGVRVGELLASRGVALAAWTLRDEGAEASMAKLASLFDLGTTTVITDHPLLLAGYARALSVSPPLGPGVAV